MALSDTETLNFVAAVTLAAAITHKETHTSADIIKFDARLAWFSFGSHNRIVLENYTPTLPQPFYPFARTPVACTKITLVIMEKSLHMYHLSVLECDAKSSNGDQPQPFETWLLSVEPVEAQ